MNEASNSTSKFQVLDIQEITNCQQT